MFGFAKFCRLCLGNSNPLVNISKTDSNAISYCDKIKDFMPELVTGRYKSFPPWICNSCSEELNKYYLFRQKCLGAHELLKKYRKQLKSLKVDYRPINPTTRSSWNYSERPPRNSFNRSPRNNIEHSRNNNSEPVVKTNESFEVSNNDNSSDTNISIVKNEIPVTEADEFSFKCFYKTLLKPETETGAANQPNDIIANNGNTNENEVEIKEQIISLSTENANQQIIIKEVTSQAPENPLKQGVKPQNTKTNLNKTKKPSSGEHTSKQDENKKQQNNPSQFSDEDDREDSEQSSSENTASPPLNLRKRRRLSYNERSDNEDFSADEDSDFEPEKVDDSNSIKKLKHTFGNKSKVDSAKTVTENTTSSDLNIKNSTQTEKQRNSNDKYEFKIYTSSNVSKVISINKSKCKSIGSRSELGPDSLNIKNSNIPISCEKVKENVSNTEPRKILQTDVKSNKKE